VTIDSSNIMSDLSDLERHLLNDFQHNLPLVPAPYAEMAQQLGVSEDDVLNALQSLQDSSLVSRVGAVFKPNRIGVSTLAAMSVPVERLDEVAKIINSYPEVNHNYEREHAFNMWFVATAANDEDLHMALQSMEQQAGLTIMSLPMVEDYHIDLGFPLQWGHGAAGGYEGDDL